MSDPHPVPVAWLPRYLCPYDASAVAYCGQTHDTGEVWAMCPQCSTLFVVTARQDGNQVSFAMEPFAFDGNALRH